MTATLKAGNSNQPVAQTPVAMAAKDAKTQSALERMVTHYGTGYAFYADSPNVLKAHGLTLEDISPALLTRIGREMDGRVQEINSVAKAQIVGKMAKLENLSPGTCFELSGFTGRLLQCDGCTAKVEALNGKVRSIGDVAIVAKDIRNWSPSTVVKVIEEPVDAGSDDNSDAQNQEEIEMELMIEGEKVATEKQLKSMLEAVGYEHVEEAKQQSLAAKVKMLKRWSQQEGFKEPASKEDRDLVRQVLEALEAGKEVKVVDANGEVTKKGGKKATKPKAEKKPKGSPRAKKTKVAAGQTITTTYKGKEYTVKTTEEGIKYGDKMYPSLTAVAKAITKYPNISGPVFFGLKK